MATTQTAAGSKRYTIDWRDIANGLIMAVWGAVGGQVYAIIVAWASSVNYHFDRASLIITAKGAAFASVVYLAKKFTERSKIILLNPSKEDVKAVKAGEATVEVKK